MDCLALIGRVERWVALRTAARWEKAVVEQLTLADVPHYLPLMTRLHNYKGTRRSAQVPVFPGYVFCSEDDYRDNKRVSPACRKKVAQMLRPPDPARLRKELAAVAELLSDRQLVQEAFYGKVGDTVRIVGGPLSGHLGEILRLKPGTNRIVLEVSFLGTRVEATVEERYLAKESSGERPAGRALAG